MSDDQLLFDWGVGPAEPTRSGVLPTIEPLARRLQELAEQNVFLGTSSWKYPGWLGQVYDPMRYRVRNRFSQKAFDTHCLEEYARIFPTVCGDFAFYQFPTRAKWQETFERLPQPYRFTLKVPDEITVDRFPNLPRYGDRAGKENPSFLDAGVLQRQLLAPLEPHRDQLGVLILQFGQFHSGPFADAARFSQRLGKFFDELPTDRFQFAVEIRNREFLEVKSGYLGCLRDHAVAHCLNNWTRMPSIAEQLRIPDVITTHHVAARFLLRPGRTYEEAVQEFEPYDRVQDPNPEGRAALKELIEWTLRGGHALFAFVNNRFEGNAVETIKSVVAT